MAKRQKIKLFDLAKALDADPELIFEDARREGINSASVPLEVARSILNKYLHLEESARSAVWNLMNSVSAKNVLVIDGFNSSVGSLQVEGYRFIHISEVHDFEHKSLSFETVLSFFEEFSKHPSKPLKLRIS